MFCKLKKLEVNKSSELPHEVQELEQTNLTTTNQNGYYNVFPGNYSDFAFCLYHGIRFQNYLEKLENIFKERKILAGKYLGNYLSYDDNCNKGEYVSLLSYLEPDSLEYNTFITPNISLVVSPLCDAIETKYVNYNTWNEIKDKKLKNLYSYMHGECLCKDFVSLNLVLAIGVPYRNLQLEDKTDYANQLILDIEKLMKKYDIDLPIVDTSKYNFILRNSKKDIKVKKYNKF